jgi:hypothetical protein
VYYAQRDFQKAHGRWATTFGDLAITSQPPRELSDASMRVADSLYEVSVTLNTSAGPQRWHIRQDSLIWRD